MRLAADPSVTWTDAGAPTGAVLQKVYLGPDPFGLGGFQMAVATATTEPSSQPLRDLFAARQGRTQIQLIVSVVQDGAYICSDRQGAWG